MTALVLLCCPCRAAPMDEVFQNITAQPQYFRLTEQEGLVAPGAELLVSGGGELREFRTADGGTFSAPVEHGGITCTNIMKITGVGQGGEISGVVIEEVSGSELVTGGVFVCFRRNGWEAHQRGGGHVRVHDGHRLELLRERRGGVLVRERLSGALSGGIHGGFGSWRHAGRFCGMGRCRPVQRRDGGGESSGSSAAFRKGGSDNTKFLSAEVPWLPRGSDDLRSRSAFS